jgi:hypothetical protein
MTTEIFGRASRPVGFRDAQEYFESDGFVLALWNHKKCSGWQLYQKIRSAKRKHMTGAGPDSVDWSIDRAKQWAAEQCCIQSPMK